MAISVRAGGTALRRRKREPRLDLRRGDVGLDLPDDGVVRAPLLVYQESRCVWHGLGDPGRLLDEATTFSFDLYIEREWLEVQREEDVVGPEVWEQVRTTYALPHAPDLCSDDSLVVARLEIAEIPSHMADQAGGWSDVLDALGDAMRDAHELIVELKDAGNRDTYGLSLIGGALLWPLRLGVHPRLRGNRLGLKLLAHALWALHRSDSDVAILEAAAYRSVFDTEKLPQPPDSFAALCKYYEKVGFRRWKAELEPHEMNGSIMYSTFGQCGLRAMGLGGLTHFPRRPAK